MLLLHKTLLFLLVPCAIEGQFYSDDCEGANASCSDPNSKIVCDVPQCVCPRGQVIDTVANVCINGTECSKYIINKINYEWISVAKLKKHHPRLCYTMAHYYNL